MIIRNYVRILKDNYRKKWSEGFWDLPVINYFGKK